MGIDAGGVRPVPPPRFRETRPVRLGAAGVGLGAGMTWFVLLAATSWNLLSYLVLTLSGLVLAVLVTGLLFARGDRGVAVGLVVAAGTAAALLFLAAWIGWNG